MLVGTFSFWATIAAVVFAVGIGLCLPSSVPPTPQQGASTTCSAECSVAEPGSYSSCSSMTFYVLILATYALGAGLQLQSVWASIDPKLVGVIFLAIAAVLAIPEVKVGAWVTGGLLILQFVIVGIVVATGLVHAHSPSARLFHVSGINPDGSHLTLTFSFVVLGLTLAIFNFAGPGNAIIFAEETETHGARSSARCLVRSPCSSSLSAWGRLLLFSAHRL